MAKLNFPGSPTPGTIYTENGNVWKWNGSSWISFNSLDLTSQVAGALGVTYGGTGYSTYTLGDILVGAGSSFIKLPVGSNYTVLSSDNNSGSGLTWKGLLAPTYGAFGSTSLQQVTAANTETLVTYNLTYEANNVSIGSGTTTRIYINESGVFNIQFSAQISLATGNTPQNLDLWFKIDGVNVPKSNTRQTIAGKDNEVVFGLNFVSTFISGQYIELAYSSPSANIQLGTYTNLTSPTRPDIPSMILTVTPVSSLLPGSGLAITGLASLNLLTANSQTFAVGTSGVDFNINSSGSVHTFNIPNASATNRGLITSSTQTIGGNKTFFNDVLMNSNTPSVSATTGTLIVEGGVGIGGSLYVSSATGISGVFINNGTITGNLTGTASTATYSLQSGYGITAGTATTSNYSLQSGYGITAGLATTSVYSNQAGYAITSGSSGTATTATYANQSGYGITAGTASTSTYSLQSGYGITSGTATTAQNINVIAANTNSNHVLLFTPTSGSASGLAVSSNSTLVYNPSTEILSVSGLAVTSGTLTTSSSSGSLIVTGGVGIGSSLNVLGRVGIGTNLHSAQINVRNSTSSTTGIIIQGATSQSADYLQILSSSGTTTFSINSSGRLSWPSSSVAQIYSTSYSSQGRIVVSGNLYVNPGPFIVDTGAGEASMTSTAITFGGVGWGSYGSPARVSTDNAVRIQPTSTSVVPLVVQLQNASWTSGNAFEIQNNGALRFNVDYAGNTVLLSSTAATNSSSGALVVTGGVGIGGSLFVAGDLTINGTTTTINSVTLTVDDKNIELGSVTSPSDVTAEGGGITLKGLTDKFINWYTGTGWSSSESWNLISGNTYKINNTTVLSASSIGTGITNSSLTALGTITTGVWSGTAITPLYGGTGLQPTFTVGDILYANSSTTWNRLTPGTNGFVLTSAGTANTPTYTNPSNLSVGLATTSSNSRIASAGNSNSIHLILFTPASSTSGSAISSDTTFSFNPSTEILSVSGLAVTSSTNSASITTGALSITGGVGIGQSVSLGGRLQLFNGSNYTAFVSSASGNTIYTLPATTPSTGSSVLQSTSAGVLSWVPLTAAGLAVSGSTDGTVQFKSGSSLGATNSLFFSPSLLGLRVSGFPGGETPSGADAALKVEQTTGSFNGSVSGTMIAVNANTGFAGDLLNLQVNAVSRFRIDNTGAVIQNIGTNSTSTTSGAVQIRGGVGITGAVYIGESVNATSLTQSTNTTTGSLVVSGGAGISGALNIGGASRIFSSTASTNTSTGALLVAGGVGISGQLSFVTASLGFTGVTTNPTMSFIGATSSSPITLTVQTDNSLNWEGSSGSLFSIDNNLSSGEIFAVSDISGLPIISASAGQTVNINEFGGYTQIGNGTINSSTTSNGSLVIAGGLGMTGNANIGGTVRISNGTNSASTSSGSLVVLGGLGITGNAFIGGTTTITSGTNSFSTATGALVVNGGLGVTGNANIGGTVRISSSAASTSSSTGALSVVGGVGIGQSLFVGGSIFNSNYFYSGGNNFSKAGQAQGDVILDNNSNDTPGVLFYYRNNTNFGIDAYAVGIGATRLRIVRDLNESTGSEIWSIDRTGIVTRSAWDVGETINTRMYDYNELSMSATTTVGITSFVRIANINYTPKSSSSYIWIEFNANYDFNNGTTVDDFWSNITVNGTEIAAINQRFLNASGGGTRSGVLFPISGRYTNSSTSGIAITVSGKRGSADDDLRVFGSSTSGYMRIMEIGR